MGYDRKMNFEVFCSTESRAMLGSDPSADWSLATLRLLHRQIIPEFCQMRRNN